MAKENISALFNAIGNTKGVQPEIIIDAIKQGIVSAYKRQYGQAQNVEAVYDEETGQFYVYSVREVVEEVFDSRLEISLADARQLNELYEVGDKIRFQEELKKFARTSISIAKQIVVKKLREEEQNVVYNDYKKYENEIITGTVERMDEKAIYINLGHVDAMLTKYDQIQKERYRIGDRIQVFVTRVDMAPKGVRVYVSRTAPDMIKRLIEREVPEVYQGVVEIVNVAREAGDRAKVLVRSHDKNVDAIGTVVGSRGARIQAVINELHGENMDIIEWSSERATLVRNVLKPARIEGVLILKDGSALAIVPDDQLSLAIGKRGQNVRLAAHVANVKIDIKKASEFNQEDYAEAMANQVDGNSIREEDELEETPIEMPDLPVIDKAELEHSSADQVGLEELLGDMDIDLAEAGEDDDNDEAESGKSESKKRKIK